MNLLLDTHVFLWLILGHVSFSSTARALCEDGNNTLYLSSISVWEISMKQQSGKLALPRGAGNYITEKRMAHEIEPLAFSETSAMHLDKLPPVHQDPFDRMLICQALEHHLTLLTSDRMIRQYPLKTIW